MTLITVERLVERFEDKIAADEQSEVYLQAIARELQGIRVALELFATASGRIASVLERVNQQ